MVFDLKLQVILYLFNGLPYIKYIQNHEHQTKQTDCVFIFLITICLTIHWHLAQTTHNKCSIKWVLYSLLWTKQTFPSTQLWLGEARYTLVSWTCWQDGESSNRTRVYTQILHQVAGQIMQTLECHTQQFLCPLTDEARSCWQQFILRMGTTVQLQHQIHNLYFV
jgi:hypothetical protein